jgi:hypothetical protein
MLPSVKQMENNILNNISIPLYVFLLDIFEL